MSLRLEMLQVARLAPKLLGESTELVREFLSSQQNQDGGFRDRAGRSDLYYTVFGLDGLLALQVELPQQGTLRPLMVPCSVEPPGGPLTPSLSPSEGERVPEGRVRGNLDPFTLTRTGTLVAGRIANYVRSFGDGEGLDFVHLCCLARCWGGMDQGSTESRPPKTESGHPRNEILRRIEAFRTKDGGYSPLAGSDFGTAYGCFLALGAYQDLKAELPEPLRLVQCLKYLETKDGAWANERKVNVGATNATAAAVTLLRNLSLPVNPSAGDWLLARSHPEGGFLSTPNAPVPDLLSTATALHALAGLQVSFERVKEPCLDFIDSLWTNEGGFHGHWSDEHLDCEYTYYGLLALGHLAL